jgi:peptidoglycan/LPS O-acetylase OafA/YrhL
MSNSFSVQVEESAVVSAQPGMQHLPQLDGIRGIAILLVLCTHLGSILRSEFFSHYLEAGWIGVDLFFVLSGFLITRILLNTREGEHYYSRFYIRRGLRIWPLYYVYIGLIFGGLALLTHTGAIAKLTGHGQEFSFSFRTPAILYVFYLQNLYPKSLFSFYDPLSITWSLCIEEHFYLLWPLLIRKLSLSSLKRVLWTVLFLSPLARMAVYFALKGHEFKIFYQTVYRVTPFHIDAIVGGSLLALYLYENSRPNIFKKQFWLMMAAGVAMNIVCIPWSQENGIVDSIVFSCVAAMFTGVVGLSLLGWQKRLFTLKPLRYFGKISYGLYLLHMPVVLLFQSHHFLHKAFHISNTVVLEFSGAIVAMGLSVAIASFSFRFFEQPMLNLKGRLAP